MKFFSVGFLSALLALFAAAAQAQEAAPDGVVVASSSSASTSTPMFAPDSVRIGLVFLREYYGMPDIEVPFQSGPRFSIIPITGVERFVAENREDGKHVVVICRLMPPEIDGSYTIFLNGKLSSSCRPYE